MLGLVSFADPYLCRDKSRTLYRVRTPFQPLDTLDSNFSTNSGRASLSELGEYSSLTSEDLSKINTLSSSKPTSPHQNTGKSIQIETTVSTYNTKLGIPDRNLSGQSEKMVNQREPAKPPSSHHLDTTALMSELPKTTQSYAPTSSEFKVPKAFQEVTSSQAKLGKTSPPQNNLQPEHSLFSAQGSLRNPERRAEPPGLKTFVQPQFLSRGSRPSPDVVEIPRPTNPPLRQIPAAPVPKFSSLGPKTTFEAYDPRIYNPNILKPYDPNPKSFAAPSNTIDLTTNYDGFNPDAGLKEDGDKFGAVDPYTYVDAAKANENIKALLEGAFEDEEDKPRIRLRSRKAKPAEKELKSLGDKLKNLAVKEESSKDAEDEEAEEDGTVDGLSVKLLPHQVEGVAWMLDKEIGGKKRNGVLPKGGILADDMGLGKTIQSVALILTNPRPTAPSSPGAKSKPTVPSSATKCTLVIAPLSLIKQWESEISTRILATHKLKVLVHHGTNRTRRSKDLEKFDVVITTYQIIVSEYGGSQMDKSEGIRVGCMGVHWYRVILDEAHTIKNRNAKSTQACYALKSVYRWCLTGTPMQNNLDELQSLIKFLGIRPYRDLGPWREQITQPMKNGRGGLAMKRLGFFLKAFMKRRTKDVLKNEGALNFGGKIEEGQEGGESKGFKIVARKIEKIVAQFDPEEQAFYDRLQARTESRLEEMMGGKKNDYIGALVLLLRLRQACNHPLLVGGNAAKDKDALTTGSEKSSQTSGRQRLNGDDELDDVANLLGGLSVTAKKCDVCQIELPSKSAADGAIRCNDCEQDLASQRRLSKRHNKHQKTSNARREDADKTETSKPSTRRNKKVVLDSDDEEEEAERDWVVPKSQQHMRDLGKAGGSDDENAEGGGEDLGSEDSETDEDGDEQLGRSTKTSKKVINLESSDAENNVSATDNNLEDDDDDEFSSSEDEDAIALVASSKVRYLLDILEKETEDHKIIVFSQFTSMLDIIEPFLKKAGFVFTRYDGSMKNDLREASLNRLRNDRKTRVLLCSLKCGSLGLNLTAASRVVILEPFWNPVRLPTPPTHTFPNSVDS